MRRLPYQEGSWFAVPLGGGGFALGLAARIDGRGGLVGYFFGPRRSNTPTLNDVTPVTRENAVAVCQLGDLHLVKGKWPILGCLPGWPRDEWPLPAFGRQDLLLGDVAWRVEYSETDLNRPVREVRISPEECAQLPKDGILGAVAVEHWLDHLLRVQ